MTKKITSIQVGDSAEVSHCITEQDIKAFVELTGDDNRLHVDPDFASKTNLQKPVVHGMLGASFISTVIGTKLPGDGAMWYQQELEFVRPVRQGDVITVRAEVTKKNVNLNILELKTEIMNQKKELVTRGKAKVKIVEPEVPEENEPQTVSPVALVLGGNGGIGSATCVRLARDGFDVVINYLDDKRAASLVRDEVEKIGRKALTIQCDITDGEAVKSMVDTISSRLGIVSVVVNCTTAGLSFNTIEELQWSDFEKHLKLAIKGTLNAVQAVLPGMENQRYGKVITLISQAVEQPVKGWGPYITAKAALGGFSRSLAVELAGKGIRVNVISPGMTKTELIADFPDRMKMLVEAQTPLKRMAIPEDIAEAVSFLASPRSDFIAGETIRINGGQTLI